MERKSDARLKLPLAVISRVDVGRLHAELTALDEFLNQAALRRQAADLPRTSKLLEALASDNGVNLLQAQSRKALLKFLARLKSDAPLLHISFAADPSPAFLQKLISWLRQEINPMILVQVGLQPSIAAGCVVRSSNKYFDFSLRRHFADKRPLLLEKLGVL